MFWPFNVQINCSIYLQNFANSWPSASHFQKFFVITGTIFSHNSSEQVSITFKCQYEMFSHDCSYFLCFWTCFKWKIQMRLQKSFAPITATGISKLNQSLFFIKGYSLHMDWSPFKILISDWAFKLKVM